MSSPPSHPRSSEPLGSCTMQNSAATFAAFFTAFAATFRSTVAPCTQDTINTKLNVTSSYGTLVASLYLVGSLIGPFLFALLGEMFGR